MNATTTTWEGVPRSAPTPQWVPSPAVVVMAILWTLMGCLVWMWMSGVVLATIVRVIVSAPIL